MYNTQLPPIHSLSHTKDTIIATHYGFSFLEIAGRIVVRYKHYNRHLDTAHSTANLLTPQTAN